MAARLRQNARQGHAVMTLFVAAIAFSSIEEHFRRELPSIFAGM
jgi:hypothetical protein